MKLMTCIMTAAALCLGGTLWQARAADEDKQQPVEYAAAQGFVAHEWGVSVHDERHPYSADEIREDLAGCPVQCSNIWANAVKAPAGADAKPVLFLYTDKDRKATVTVEAANGYLMYCAPSAGAKHAEVANAREYPYAYDPHKAFRWRNISVAMTADAALPDAPAGHWWSKCREVKCATVTVPKGLASFDGMSGTVLSAPESEKFLFYDGAENYIPKIAFTVNAGEGIDVTNKNGHAMLDVYIVERSAGGSVALWGHVDAIGKNETVSVQWNDGRETFENHLRARLVAAGLYADEAAAFWAAWETQFWTNDGVRVIYRLPQSVMDDAMPLTIEPKPAKVVRVNWACVGK